MHRLSPPILLGLTLLLLCINAASAQESERSRQLTQDIVQNQERLAATRSEIEQLDRQLADLSTRIQSQLEERDALSRQIVELSRQRGVLVNEITRLELELTETEADIDRFQSRLDGLKTRLETLLVNLYKQRTGRFAGLLAESESFHDLRVKNHYLSLLTEQEVALVEEVNATLQQLETAQAELTTQVEALRIKEADLQSKEASLESARADLERVIASLQESEEGKRAARREHLKAQEAFLQTITNLQAARAAEIERLRQEAAAKRQAALEVIEERQRQRLLDEAEANEAAAAALAAPSAPPESDLILPVTGAKLLAPFGSQGEPGIVLQAGQAYAAVRAVMSGVVIRAQFFQANTGHIVVIAHGPELFTTYRNLQAPTVDVGDQVGQGDVIGYLGGGSLVSPDWLIFNLGTSREGGTEWQDPAPLLGFR